MRLFPCWSVIRERKYYLCKKYESRLKLRIHILCMKIFFFLRVNCFENQTMRKLKEKKEIINNKNFLIVCKKKKKKKK